MNIKHTFITITQVMGPLHIDKQKTATEYFFYEDSGA